jgi:hypothetical protein
MAAMNFETVTRVLSLEERFWAKVDKGDVDDCWNWLGPLDGNGYGVFSIDGRTVRANRMALELGKGPIPDGLIAMHLCDNRACCNPGHIRAGTQADNMLDMRNKGRQAKGERNGRSKLTAADVLAIRELYGSYVNSTGQLAKGFGVDKATIRAIVRGETWKHLPGAPT